MFDWEFFVDHIFKLGPNYQSAIMITISLAIICEILGIILGSVINFLSTSRFAVVRLLVSFYIWFFRGTPELVLLVLIYSGLAIAGIFRFTDFHIFGIKVTANYQAAVVAISLREAAYMAEIIRAGFLSIKRGQLEAAKSIGLTPTQVLWHISIPQALRVIVPPFGNEFNILLKVTTLASVIGVGELFLITQTYGSTNFKTFELFVGLAINYLILTTVWSVIQTMIEMRLQRYNASEPKLAFSDIVKKIVRNA